MTDKKKSDGSAGQAMAPKPAELERPKPKGRDTVRTLHVRTDAGSAADRLVVLERPDKE